MHRVHASTRRATTVFALSLLATLAAGCARPPEGPGVDRETFIATYVDLRAEALLSDSLALSEAQRVLILDEHGVAEDDLLAFADYHGEDVEFMRELWDEVEERLDALRPEVDEGGDLVRPVQRPSDRISG